MQPRNRWAVVAGATLLNAALAVAGAWFQPLLPAPLSAEQVSRLESIARKYHVATADLIALRQQPSPLDWAELGNALAVCLRAGQPLKGVVQLRDLGLTWQDIAKRFGLNLNDLTGDAREAERMGRESGA